ncbi:abortive infection protein [Leptolyngbya boryana NIES-2135]|jgi:predicted Abi (CAAX) family protease|uniref:Abortive infection protein n=1 Tax=Leptolyngbya boryana NIES-2135 TaxID=1973484 RepID=A0A1Z4JNY5_LEPBY|nr:MULTISPECIES: hypothetical protein [Leptolyngbya]ULP29498.1 hypothetical protein MCP04_26305 [Leptolyngbya boryana IU 594]BAS55419.1 hypothetical protein LBWT_13270 [Leptolyngbya boryana IAM M-101]BAS61767.1 hypothetical protein LBDG_13270 [Leptolyngbya boryana dg5]BAY58424.1 abortive infection protein [Leptolyngbya boryana NIES-2135]
MEKLTISNLDGYYLPIAPWTGRLILPQTQQRRQDGGVFIEIQNVPASQAHLKGQQVWLTWHRDSIHQPWLAKATRDLRFDQITRDSQAKGNIHPVRLDGWQQVSPLESLIGARAEDDMQVELDVVSVDREAESWIIRINDEPIQIEGIARGFVQFVAPVGGKDYRVRHYDRTSRRFEGAEEIVSLPASGTLNPKFNLEQSSIVNIEKLPLNANGWYIYGARGRDGKFMVQALEPAEILRLPPEQMVIGREETQNYVDRDKWKQMPLHQVNSTLVDNNGQVVPPTQRTVSLLERRTRELWQRGDEALVLHTFGWRGGARANKIPIVTGHFSFGFAKLLPDEFTGALRFRLIYRQVYAHSPLSIVSGAQSWHCYMGSLQRGWMYTIPVSDVLVRMPELVAYKMGSYTFNPLNLIKRELAYMEARYRSGDGNGASVVTPSTSCVRDSNQALFGAIRKFRDQVVNDPTVSAWLVANPNDYHARRFAGLRSLLERVENNVLFPMGYVPRSWRGENDRVAVQDRDRFNGLGNVLEALRTWRTMLPRRAERSLLAVFREHGATMIDYQSAMLGGEVPGIVPLPPGVIL